MIAIFTLWASILCAEVYYEGTATFRGYGKVDLNWLVQFLPFNPILVIAGSSVEDQINSAIKLWPQHQRLIAFESDHSSQINHLDEWCSAQNLDHIDVLRLALEGKELEALQGAQRMLKNTKILVLSTFFPPLKPGTVFYYDLKAFLTKANFVPLAHWYDPYGKGEAVYISQELFDAYFIRCLGLGLGGLLYP